MIPKEPDMGDQWEPFLEPVLGRGRFAIDVGAHVGQFSYRLRKRYRSIWAFEPGPEQHRKLCENLRRHHIQNVDATRWALWAHRAQLSVTYADGTASMRVMEDPEGPIHAQALDDFGAVGLDFMKIDVEGSEARVLAGAKATIRGSQPRLLIEVHERAVPDGTLIAAQVKEQLADLGYEWIKLRDAGTVWHLYALPRGPHTRAKLQLMRARVFLASLRWFLRLAPWRLKESLHGRHRWSW